MKKYYNENIHKLYKIEYILIEFGGVVCIKK